MPLPMQKNQTVKREYNIAVSDVHGTIYTTVQVRAEGVRDALKQAYEKVSGWQMKTPEALD